MGAGGLEDLGDVRGEICTQSRRRLARGDRVIETHFSIGLRVLRVREIDVPALGGHDQAFGNEEDRNPLDHRIGAEAIRPQHDRWRSSERRVGARLARNQRNARGNHRLGLFDRTFPEALLGLRADQESLFAMCARQPLPADGLRWPPTPQWPGPYWTSSMYSALPTRSGGPAI